MSAAHFRSVRPFTLGLIRFTLLTTVFVPFFSFRTHSLLLLFLSFCLPQFDSHSIIYLFSFVCVFVLFSTFRLKKSRPMYWPIACRLTIHRPILSCFPSNSSTLIQFKSQVVQFLLLPLLPNSKANFASIPYWSSFPFKHFNSLAFICLFFHFIRFPNLNPFSSTAGTTVWRWWVVFIGKFDGICFRLIRTHFLCVYFGHFIKSSVPKVRWLTTYCPHHLAFFHLPMRFASRASSLPDHCRAEKQNTDSLESNQAQFMHTPPFCPLPARFGLFPLPHYTHTNVCPESIKTSLCCKNVFRFS